MANRAFKPVSIVILVVAALAVLFGPMLWRLTTYKAIRRGSEAGNENEAIQQVLAASKNPLFKPDWTLSAALPKWQWLRELDFQLFGCPTCRGNWRTLLQCAAGQGQPQLVKVLLANGASVKFYGDNGCSALQAAVGGGDTNVIATLLAHGANVNATNFFGSVIHAAAGFSPNPAVLEFLISAGADLSATNSNGWTALDFATVWNTNAVPLLVSYGASTGGNRRIPLPIRNN